MDTIFTSPQGRPAQTVQEIPSQQVPVPPATTLTPSPVKYSPQKTNFRKVFNISSWIILFALLPVTVLIFLSQDSIPGDFFYPLKRSLENVVLAAASVNPSTRAAFKTDLTEARFKEAQGLITSRSNISGLTTFIDEVQSTRLEVTNLKNDTQREKAQEKLISKIEEYQNNLSVLEAKTEQKLISYGIQEIPTSAPSPIAQSETVTPSQGQTFSNLSPTPIPTIILIPTQTKISTPTPTNAFMPTSMPVGQASSAPSKVSAPTLTLIPTETKNVPAVLPQPESIQTDRKSVV